MSPRDRLGFIVAGGLVVGAFGGAAGAALFVPSAPPVGVLPAVALITAIAYQCGWLGYVLAVRRLYRLPRCEACGRLLP